MKTAICLILLPLSLWAQEFPFQFNPQGIPVEFGGYQLLCAWAPGMSESTPAFCDIDADGDFDFFAGDFQDSVGYYINQGSTTQPDFLFLTSAFASLFCLAGSRSSFDFGDLDNDGDFDICMGQGAGAVYWNTGSISAPEFYPIPDTLRNTQGALMVATHPELADIDADGDLDLIAGHYGGTIYLYRNIGTADSMSFLFETSQWLGIDVGTKASPTFCDLDDDGDLDLFVGTGSGYVGYYRNDGTAQQYNFTLVSNNWLNLDVGDYSSPEFCDIDGDGDWDLFVGREINYSNPTNGDVFFYENTGTPTVYNFQFITPNYLTLDVGYTARLQLVDIDADNDLDLFICAGNVMRFFPNIGTPSAPSFLWESDAYEGIAVQDMVPSFADLDADGDFDLLAGSGAIPGPPGIYLFQNRGTPQQAQFVLYSSNFVPANYFVMVAPTLADIDADGDLDLILTDQDNTGTLDIWYFQNNGSAQWPDFQLVTQNWQGIYIYSGLQRYLQFYDIDQDGDLDLFFFNNWDEPGGLNLRFYENQGTPQNASMVLNTSSYLPSAVIMACPWFCDIDADDHTDLFVGDSDGGVLFFHGLDDTSGWVLPPVQRHPLAGLELALGPNPANPLTVIRCQLPVASNISLEVFDISGRKLVELASGFHLPGEYRYVWDAGNRAAGMYVVRLKTGRETVGKKLVILK